MARVTARVYTGRFFPRVGTGGSVDEGRGPCAQYISLKDLLGVKRSKRVKQVDKVKKLIIRLKGRRWRDIALLGLILAVDLLDLAAVDAQAALGQDMPCHLLPQTLA